MLEQIAVIFGTILGAALKQCAPIIADIIAEGIKRAVQDTCETGKPAADDPQQRTFARLLRVRDSNSSAAAGDSSHSAEASK